MLIGITALVGCAHIDRDGNTFPKSSHAFQDRAEELVKPGDNLRQAGLTLRRAGFFLHGDFGPGVRSLNNNYLGVARTYDDDEVKATLIDYSGPRYSQWVILMGHDGQRVTTVSPKYTSGWALDF